MLSEVHKEKLFSLADAIHRRFFGSEMSAEAKKFLGNLSWSFFGGGVSSGILFLSFLFLGWSLGPVSYGKFTLIYAGILFITSLIVFGFDSGYIKFASQLTSSKQQGKLLARLFLISVFIYLLLILIFSQTEYSHSIYVFTVLAFVIKAFVDAFIRQKQQFSLQQRARFLEGIVLVSILAILFVLRKLTVETAILSYAIGALCFSLTLVHHIITSYHGQVPVTSEKKNWVQNKWIVIEYSFLLYVNGLIGFFYSYGDKFLLNHFIDNATLGQYSAYYTVSVMVVSQLALLFINVFFPTLVEKDQSRGVAKQLEKAYIKIGLWLFIPLVTWIYLVVGMLGAGYDQSIFLSVGFALLTYINTFFLLLWWQIAALGNKGVRFMIETGVISVCIFLGVFFLGVGHFSVYVTLLALNLALIFNIIRGRSFLQLNT